ncbi:PucR family transcriptional regulator [Streptomyces hokutonensis]|uniref:PucR family transcriptional regulator n=1 Tax=Streptomyces hokutonensis TaxID=1306990 RepID=UPI00036B764C|nr:helix-turn-helix domain-containing protein [Streptomyces hokutonensis]
MVDKEINALATALLERIDELTKEMAARIRAGSRAYHYDVVPEEDLEDACRTHAGNALQALTGQVPLDTGAAADIGRRRAAQNVPLPSVMTAYRVGVRYFWEAVVAEATTTSLVGNDILVAAASAMWEIQDGITEAMVSGYHEAVAERLLAGDQERSALVEALLEGRSMDADAVWSAAEVLDVPHKGPFTVVAAEVPRIGRRALPDIAAVLNRRGIRSAWRLRPELQLGIVHLRTPRDLDDLVGVLREQAERRVGVSPSYDDLSRTGDALRFAKVALRGGDAGSAAVTVFDDSPVAVATAGAPDVMARVAAQVLGPVEALPEDERALLLDTLEAWFDSGGSAEEAAKVLYVHPNTIRSRLRRITERTSRSLTDPRGITELSLALRAVRQTPRPPTSESTGAD